MLNEYRGASMLLRENTKEINIGGVKIGGTNRIAIQSMTNTFTEDVDKTVAQIFKNLKKFDLRMHQNNSSG